MPPKVSVGLPVYNGEPYLVDALQGIADQTFDDLEIIISDNASTDQTEDIGREFAESDPRFHYVRQAENLGAARNYNDVVDRARGELFKWAAADDLIAPTFLQRCVETLDEAPPDVVLCYPKTIVIDADGDEIETYEDRLDLRMERPSDRFDTYLRDYSRSNAMFGLHRLDRLRQTRLHGNYVSADLVLLAEIVLNGQVWEIPERLFYRRYHEEMSLRANVTPAEITTWFDPAKATVHVMPRTRLSAEHVRAIGRAPISVDEKARCLWSFLSVWGRVTGGRSAVRSSASWVHW